MAPPPNTKNFVWSGCICMYSSCEVEDILLGCAGSEELLCLRAEGCCGVSTPTNPVYPIGLVQERGTICKLSLACVEYVVKSKPTVCLSGTSQCLCIKTAAAFPFADPVPKPVCAICGFKILPGPAGFLQPYEGGGAPSAKVVAR